MTRSQAEDLERLRLMAASVDCFIEEDFRLLAGATQGTIEAWRKRGRGPSYVRLGNRFLYPRDAVAEHLRSLARDRGAQWAPIL